MDLQKARRPPKLTSYMLIVSSRLLQSMARYASLALSNVTKPNFMLEIQHSGQRYIIMHHQPSIDCDDDLPSVFVVNCDLTNRTVANEFLSQILFRRAGLNSTDVHNSSFLYK